MKRNPVDKENLECDRQTVWFYPDEGDVVARDFSGETTEVFMLVEDVYNGVLPLGHSHEEKWQVVLQPESEQTEKIVAWALDREGHGYRLRDSLRKFVEECARELVQDGECVYEIARWNDPHSGQTELFELMPVPRGTLKHYRGYWHQHLPAHVAERCNKPRVIKIDKQRLISFTWPTSVCSKLQYKRMRSSLQSLGRNFISKINMDAYDPAILSSERVPFDQTISSITRAKATAEATRHLGYNHRLRFYKECGEYYYFMRELRFHRFKIALREAILARLNDALLQVEVIAGPVGQIVITGLPTIQDVDEAETYMREGTRSVSEIMNKFRLNSFE